MKQFDKIIFVMLAMLILAGTAQAFSDEERRHYPLNGSTLDERQALPADASIFADESIAGAAPAEQWNKTFGRSGRDEGYSVQQTADGGYIIAGYTEVYYGDDDDVYLIKTDASGSILWNKTFGGSDYDQGYSVQQTTDGGYIIAGYTNAYGAGGADVYLIKTDASGSKLWEKTFWESDWAEGYSVQQTADGGYIIAGYSYADSADVYLVKTDASGSKQWEKTFGGSWNDMGRSVQQTADGGYIIAGYTDSYGAGYADVYLIKTDASGSKQWAKTFGGGSDNDEGMSVQQTVDGGYIIAGYTGSYGAGSWDVYLIKTNASGSELWNKTFGGSGEDWGGSVQQTADGGYIIAGYTESYGAGYKDVYLIKTDASGSKQWQKTFGGSNEDRGFSFQQTADGGYIIAGYTESYGAGWSDVWLIKAGAGAALMEGDTNLNNHVTITDALLIAKYKAGLIALTPDQLKAADTSDDSAVSLADALFIAKWLADPMFPLWDAVKDSDMLQPVP